MTPVTRSVFAPVGALIVPLLVLLPAGASAHARLVASEPADGAVLQEPPGRILVSFDEALGRDRSRVTLRGPDGQTVAEGSVPADDGTRTNLVITELPPLAPGSYEIRWLAYTPSDEHLERGTLSFTVESAPETESPAPTAGATPVPSAPASPGATGPAATSSPAAASPTAVAPPSSAPSAPPTTPGSGEGGSVVLPLAALGAVAVAAVVLLLRRPRR